MLTLQSPVVTICSASLTFNNSTFCPHSVFMCFVWIWEQTAIISLYSINWLVYITEIVYFAVRTEYLNEVRFGPQNSCRSLTEEARVWFQVSPCKICGVQTGTGTAFPPRLRFCPVCIIPPLLHTLLCIHVALTGRTNGRSLGTLKKAMIFRKSGETG